ncbi:hypothetical protein NS365_17230 [Aureimonas ureilytica]|uniref:Lipoprotein n=1 Tax=Aureimonas ureilytica TaxID=401562 RepID=A0A175RM74_9HYPH|nr:MULTISPECIES: hypothetical protein [Aureimonas]KTR03902.1 hypothetical protein NS365_17230 [Aureimonas ureilytica]
MTSATTRLRVLALIGCTTALSGCMGPTYGTGVSQGQQLFNDIDNAVSLGGSNKPRVDYSPRAELVKPKSIGALPPPRDAVVDPNLPESPEMRRGRLHAAAPNPDGVLPVGFMTSKKDGMDVETPAASFRRQQDDDNSWIDPRTMAGQRTQASAARTVGQQGSPDQRKYLSEPPLTYRQPAATAPVGDPGEDEEVKERRAKGTTSVASKLGSLWPF